jgi:hypothetical protein
MSARGQLLPEQPGRPGMSRRVVRYRSDYGCQTGVLCEGRKWDYFISSNSFPITARKLAKEEQRHMTDLQVPLGLTLRRLRAAGKRMGLTKLARRLLRGG